MASFGIDFGTTNSLLSLVRGDQLLSFTNRDDNLPHPSVVGYVGSQVIVGRDAKARIQRPATGVIGDFVRSPKGFLGTGRDIQVAGKARAPKDVAAEIFKYLKKDALSRKHPGEAYEYAVVTIPVGMRGRARRELRDAALQAGIHTIQFVHEPLAALYGYLRDQKDSQRETAKLEGKLVLVFDWGGGTLDLTLCQIHRGTLLQLANEGTDKVGGDRFDDRLMQFARNEHARKHALPDLSQESPDAEAKLLVQCEEAKISLSSRDSTTLFVKDFLQANGAARNLEVTLRRSQVEDLTNDLVIHGMECIARILQRADISRSAVAFCLATGGMVQMPIIAERLRERFGVAQLPHVERADRLISEGAAWIAHDKLRLRLSKPLEVLQASNSYIPLVYADVTLPQEGNQLLEKLDLYCVDPGDGVAKFQFARPTEPHRNLPGDSREIYEVLALKIDETAEPFLERLHVTVQIDHDLIATLNARSSLAGDEKQVEIHDLEFGLGVAIDTIPGPEGSRRPGQGGLVKGGQGEVRMRSNIADSFDWALVPGEVVNKSSLRYVPSNNWQAVERQKKEKRYYTTCSFCRRTGYEITKQGCLKPCQKEHLNR